MISILLHAGPGLDDYTLHLANALADFARVGYSISNDMLARYGDALDKRVTPITFNRPRRRHLWGFGEMSRLAKKIKAFQPDIVHLQNDGMWESVLLGMLGNLPLVNTVHDPIKHIDQRNVFDLSFQRMGIQRASGWVVHSESLKEIFIQRFHKDPARILIHPHGIFDYYARYVPAPVEREKTILFFGELRHNKGCDILLRAFDAVQDQLHGWKLVIAGRGDGLSGEGELLARLSARLDLRPRFIPDAEVAELFSRAGVVALPYRHGSQSGVLAIAAAFGCPVLATRVGSLTELLQDKKHALLIEPEDINSLCGGLKAMVENPSLRFGLGENLRQLGQAEWAWRDIAQRSLKFYQQILKEKPCAS